MSCLKQKWALNRVIESSRSIGNWVCLRFYACCLTHDSGEDSIVELDCHLPYFSYLCIANDGNKTTINSTYEKHRSLVGQTTFAANNFFVHTNDGNSPIFKFNSTKSKCFPGAKKMRKCVCKCGENRLLFDELKLCFVCVRICVRKEISREISHSWPDIMCEYLRNVNYGFSTWLFQCAVISKMFKFSHILKFDVKKKKK